MSLENPFQMPWEKVWFAWYPVETESGYKWLKKVGVRRTPSGGTTLFGQPTFDEDKRYFDLEGALKK